MSIRHMVAVWEDDYYQREDKSLLLVALALADSARSEDGKCWPSVEYIAKKARTSIRGVQESCRQLEQDGRLIVGLAQGPRGTNLYQCLIVPITPLQPLHPPALVAPRSPATVAPPLHGATPPSPQPSAAPLHPNHQEPSGEPKPLCSFQEIWEAMRGFFGMSGQEFTSLGSEAMHDLSKARCTRVELDSLVRFYKLPPESKHAQVKSRKQKPSKFFADFSEQVGLAVLCCSRMPKVFHPRKPEPEEVIDEAQRAEQARRLRELRGCLRRGEKAADIDEQAAGADTRSASPSQ